MKMSIIIPVYKVEQYIERCLNSVLSQTYRNIEVILVDDCSPDHSMAKVCQCIDKSPFIKDLQFIYLKHYCPVKFHQSESWRSSSGF